VAACAAAVLLHLVAVALLPDLQVPSIQSVQHRVVLVQLAPPPNRSGALPAELQLPGPAVGIAAASRAGGGRSPAVGQPGAVQPDPLAPPDAMIAETHAGSAETGEGAGAGNAAGAGVGSGAGDGAGNGEGGGANLGFVVYDQRPVLMHLAPAPYPQAARSQRARGTVLVSVLVGVSGRVEQARVVGSVDPILDQEALRAARRCTFQPGRQGGAPAPAWITLSYRFDPP
jgi:TonB family protein